MTKTILTTAPSISSRRDRWRYTSASLFRGKKSGIGSCRRCRRAKASAKKTFSRASPGNSLCAAADFQRCSGSTGTTSSTWSRTLRRYSPGVQFTFFDCACLWVALLWDLLVISQPESGWWHFRLQAAPCTLAVICRRGGQKLQERHLPPPFTPKPGGRAAQVIFQFPLKITIKIAHTLVYAT